MRDFFRKIAAGCREIFRKFIVALKRKPQNIPLFAVTISFVWYSANLSTISLTTTRLQDNMGLIGFAIMLLSTLMIVCCMNAFPYRKPVNKSMLVLLFIMVNVVLACDIVYIMKIVEKLYRLNDFKPDDQVRILQARTVMIVHAVLVKISNDLILTLPFYSKWIRKIKTSVEVAETGEMEAIDISGE